MDLSKYNVSKQAEQGAWLELEAPDTGEILRNDEGEAVAIKVLGMDSKAWRNKNRDFQRQRIQKMARSKSRNIDYTVSDEDACELLAECTIEWKNIIENGEEIECNSGNAFDLYMKYPWIREQVDAFIGERANFFPSA
jgi:hypothetical protein